jgi:hypothetical protein
MKKFEKTINALIIGGVFPLLLGLLSLIAWYYLDKSESRAAIYLIIGLLLGIIIDLKFLKGWISHRFDMPVWFMASIYVTYNVFVFGFFMGLPVFNAFMGFFAGFYFANRICFKKIESEKRSKLINQVSLFSGLIMTLICISSAYLSLVNNEASGMIKEILGLSFEVTRSMVLGIVLVGGLVLILTNILLTRIVMVKTFKWQQYEN